MSDYLIPALTGFDKLSILSKEASRYVNEQLSVNPNINEQLSVEFNEQLGGTITNFWGIRSEPPMN